MSSRSKFPYHFNTRFEMGAGVTLTALTSGQAIRLPLLTTALLGRSSLLQRDEMVNLEDLNAYWHGVSRRHCALRRNGGVLLVKDLGSANGTFLNGDRLVPGHEYVVADGDVLTLGSLPLNVCFVASNSSQNHYLPLN